MSNKIEKPIVISVIGPRRVGKTTFINSLISHYSAHENFKSHGPIIIFNKQKMPYFCIESPSDKLSMINLTKASDIIILVIDCYFGLELETFECLTLAIAHGCPRILCILTHLDLFKDWKSLKKAKKRIKKRLKLELNVQSKIFFFSGITFNEKYLNREISNVTRYLSTIFLYPSFLQKNSSYIIISSLKIYQINNNQQLLLCGFTKGKTIEDSTYYFSYIPGIGDIVISNLNKNKLGKEIHSNLNTINLFKNKSSFLSKEYNIELLNNMKISLFKYNIKLSSFLYFLVYILFYKIHPPLLNKLKIVKYIDSNKFSFHSQLNYGFKFLLKKNNQLNNKINFEKFFLDQNKEKKTTILNKKLIKIDFNKNKDNFCFSNFKIFKSNDFPIEFKKYFDPCYPIVIQLQYPNTDKNVVIKANVNNHKWNKFLPRSKGTYMISIGWKIFKTALIFFREDFINRKRYQKYLSSDNSSLTCFYSPFVESGTTVIGINDESIKVGFRYQGTNFNILFIGNIISNNKKLNIFKKAKLKGLVFKTFKKTAFVKNMFSNELDISRFIGSLVQTTRGIRGVIKKHVINGPNGSFRANFEKYVMSGEIVFLRIWFPVKIDNRLKYKNFFIIPSDIRETGNDEFLNSSDYQMHIKNEEEINILKNFGYLANNITI
nr:BMS1-like protein [Cryptomonas curvata]